MGYRQLLSLQQLLLEHPKAVVITFSLNILNVEPNHGSLFLQSQPRGRKTKNLETHEWGSLLTQVTKGLFIPWPSGSTSQLFPHRTGKVNIEEVGAVQLQGLLQLLYTHVRPARTRERR